MTAPPNQPYQLGVAAGAMLFGALLGTAIITGSLWIVRTMQASSPVTGTPAPFGLTGVLVLSGTLIGVVAGGVAAWILMAPIESLYRRGGLSIVTGFGTLLVSIVNMPLDHYLGRTALLAFLSFCLLALLALSSYRRRHPYVAS
ncbi:MAG: hypothetical protein ABJD11_00955 [Gemmatimonadota bacterium]